MGNLVPFEQPSRVPPFIRNTLGYPVLLGLTSVFFCALWTAQAADVFQKTLDVWSGREPDPKSNIMPRVIPTPVVVRLFPH